MSWMPDTIIFDNIIKGSNGFYFFLSRINVQKFSPLYKMCQNHNKMYLEHDDCISLLYCMYKNYIFRAELHQTVSLSVMFPVL